MKPPLRPVFLLATGWIATLSQVWAHPGHDDGHELTWELGHLAAHPFATLGCIAGLMGMAWLAWQVIRRRTKVQASSEAS